ncbi:hypothetical protein PMAYCL1PPCAC_18684, partial [Pristionchus mayeri]
SLPSVFIFSLFSMTLSLEMGGTPKRRPSSRLPPPSSSMLPSLRKRGDSSHPSTSSSISTVKDHSTLAPPSIRDSSMDQLNVLSASTYSYSVTPANSSSVPGYLKPTLSSGRLSTGKTSSRIPLPLRVTPSDKDATRGLSRTRASSASIASLNDLSFSSHRGEPTKRKNETPAGRPQSILPPPKRRRFDEIGEADAVFGVKMDDDEILRRFDQKMDEIKDEYENTIVPILEKKKKMERVNETTSNSVSSEEGTVKEEKERGKVPRSLDFLASKYACIQNLSVVCRRNSQSG